MSAECEKQKERNKTSIQEEVDALLHDWKSDADTRGMAMKARAVSIDEAKEILRECWERGGAFYAFLFTIGVNCGAHMAETDPHKCCAIEASAALHQVLEERGEPKNGDHVIERLRDVHEAKAARCDCCKVVYDACVATLRENERRKSLAMIAEEERSTRCHEEP